MKNLEILRRNYVHLYCTLLDDLIKRTGLLLNDSSSPLFAECVEPFWDKYISAHEWAVRFNMEEQYMLAVNIALSVCPHVPMLFYRHDYWELLKDGIAAAEHLGDRITTMALKTSLAALIYIDFEDGIVSGHKLPNSLLLSLSRNQSNFTTADDNVARKREYSQILRDLSQDYAISSRSSRFWSCLFTDLLGTVYVNLVALRKITPWFNPLLEPPRKVIDWETAIKNDLLLNYQLYRDELDLDSPPIPGWLFLVTKRTQELLTAVSSQHSNKETVTRLDRAYSAFCSHHLEEAEELIKLITETPDTKTNELIASRVQALEGLLLAVKGSWDGTIELITRLDEQWRSLSTRQWTLALCFDLIGVAINQWNLEKAQEVSKLMFELEGLLVEFNPGPYYYMVSLLDSDISAMRQPDANDNRIKEIEEYLSSLEPDVL